MPNTSGVSQLLRDQGVRPGKGRGQNFLVDGAVVRRIVEAVGAAPGEAVLEIGPGLGALTVPLAESGARLTAVEVDDRFRPHLEALLPPSARVVIADALALDWQSVIDAPLEETTLVSNIPYAITSAFLTHLFSLPLKRAVVMVQAEVAERLVAGPGAKGRGSLSVLCESRCEATQLFRVQPTCFFPKPKVASAVVDLTFHARELASGCEAVWRGLFTYRRKTVRRALQHAFGLAADRTREILDEAGIPETARPETLRLDDFNRLAPLIFSTP